MREPADEDRAGTTERVGSIQSTSAAAAQAPGGTGRADLLLVTCVKSKLTVPAAAKDLYVSPLFTRQRAYAENRGLPWFILSAEHGLVAPEEWLAPYERYLPDTPAAYRAAWGGGWPSAWTCWAVRCQARSSRSTPERPMCRRCPPIWSPRVPVW